MVVVVAAPAAPPAAPQEIVLVVPQDASAAATAAALTAAVASGPVAPTLVELPELLQVVAQVTAAPKWPQTSLVVLGPYPAPAAVGRPVVFEGVLGVPLPRASVALERAVGGTGDAGQAGTRREGKDAPTRTRAPERLPEPAPSPTTTAPGGAASSGGGAGGSGGGAAAAMNDGRDATFTAQLIRQKPAEALLPDGNRVTLALDRPG